MGRPIKEKWFGNPDSVGYQLKLSAKFKNSSGVSVSGEAFIVKQTGTRKYVVDINGDRGVVFLKNKNSVPALVDGEGFMLLNVDGTIEPVSKLTQHRAVTWKADGSVGSYKWTKEMLSTENDEGNVTPVDPIVAPFQAATGTFEVVGGLVDSITITFAGVSYTSVPAVTSDDDGTIDFVATVVDGEVTAISGVGEATTLADGVYDLTFA